jgi:hypothetical protein
MVAQINREGNSSSQTQQVVILQGICQPAHKQTTSTKIQEKQNQSETYQFLLTNNLFNMAKKGNKREPTKKKQSNEQKEDTSHQTFHKPKARVWGQETSTTQVHNHKVANKSTTKPSAKGRYITNSARGRDLAADKHDKQHLQRNSKTQSKPIRYHEDCSLMLCQKAV